MRIVDLLHEQGIDLNFAPKNKAEAIDMLVELMDKTGNLNDKDGYKEAILAREDLSTTGIGDGIAIPHGKTKAVKNASLAAAVSKEGVDYDALDGMPSHLFFMIAAPEGENEVHLEVLARLSTILMDEEFRKSLINAKDKKEFLNLIDKKEKEKIFFKFNNRNSLIFEQEEKGMDRRSQPPASGGRTGTNPVHAC